MWRHVTMVAKCLDHNKTEFRHSTRATATRTVYISKTTTLHVHQAFFAHFKYSHRCTTATWNFLISRAGFNLRSRWTERKKFHFLFLNSDRVLSDSIQKISPTFDKLNEIEYIRSMKFETVRIYSLSELWVCCIVIQKFCCYGSVT